jgi:hypothetical protein
MIYIHSHHKCASRWAIEYMKILARLNGLRFEFQDQTVEVKCSGTDIQFFGNSSYKRAVECDLPGIHFVRNPLSIIVSAYYSHLNTHPDSTWPELTKQRSLLKNVGLEEGLYLTTAFLERKDIGPGFEGPFYALRNWDFDDARFPVVRVEDIVKRPSEILKNFPEFESLTLPSDEQFAFERYSGGREVGQVDQKSHFRSGCPNEWKEYVTPGLLAYVKTFFPSLVERYYPEIFEHKVASKDVSERVAKEMKRIIENERDQFRNERDALNKERDVLLHERTKHLRERGSILVKGAIRVSKVPSKVRKLLKAQS